MASRRFGDPTNFFPSQLLQAVGQSFALSGVLFFAVLHLRPQDALTFGAAVQTARILGGEIGLAFITTLTRGPLANRLQPYRPACAKRRG